MRTEHCTICHQDVEVCETCNVKKHHACIGQSSLPRLGAGIAMPQGNLSGWFCGTCQQWAAAGTIHQCTIGGQIAHDGITHS